ncbi:MAG: translation elongation factor Ts [Candidatus Symbiobacter sp.]|nr:translation elongation factor Ts [Candidatus Symbiobacter sp.]
MPEISANLVKELREKTGAGMMDCKRALSECDGKLDDAVDWLRKKGLSQAAKKAGRTAAEGLVGVASADAGASGSTSGGASAGAIVEINAETDFVARNEAFQKLVGDVAHLVLQQGDDVEKLKTSTYPHASHSVTDEMTRLIATIGENMSLRRAAVIKSSQGVVASYIHNSLKPGLGKIGVVIGLDSSKPLDHNAKESLLATGRQIAMHIAAANPIAVSNDQVDQAVLMRERDVLADQARASGKPEDVIAKMVEGRLRKFYEENVLLEQVYVIDNENKIKDVLAQLGKTLSTNVTISRFVRYNLGEGIEREQTNFADEVAAASGKK